jgi:hypothetical protein
MGDATLRTPESPDGFRVGDGPPSGCFDRSVARCGGAPAPLDVLLDRYPHECRDDASSGDERALQRA